MFMSASSRPKPGGGRKAAHVIVCGNEKGGSGKSTTAMHVAIALLKAGNRVATIDLDARQLSLTRYVENRRRWAGGPRCDPGAFATEPETNTVTDAGLTRDVLVRGLHTLGVRNADVVMVHASLSAFGHVGGGVETLCAAIRDAAGRAGTVVMPGFTPQLIHPAYRPPRPGQTGPTCD